MIRVAINFAAGGMISVTSRALVVKLEEMNRDGGEGKRDHEMPPLVLYATMTPSVMGR